MRGLSYIMEFDHVIRVHADGTVTDGPEDVHAPESVIMTDTATARCAPARGDRMPTRPARTASRSEMAARRQVHPYLASAHAYWRLAAKAQRSKQYKQAEAYDKQAMNRYRAYLNATRKRSA